MEVLWLQDKDNLKLLSSLIKNFSGYTFSIYETMALEDELSGVEESEAKKNAIVFYTRALDYGLFYLKKKGIKSSDLLSNDEEKLKKKLHKLDDDEDITAILYTAQSWGSLINLQRDNVALVSQVPKVKMLMDHVCEEKPEIDHNVCDFFFAQYESSRPKMLGGNPEKGEKHYLDAIKKHPKNLLMRMNYIQYVIVPAMDGDKYEEQAKVLREEFPKFSDINRDSLENVSPYRDAPTLNLYNSIAQKRFLIVEKFKKKIF
jgi:hypothetical protein